MSEFQVYVPDGQMGKLIDFLATRPDGVIRILLADTDTPVRTLLSVLTNDRELATWVKDKIMEGTLVLAVTKNASELGNEFRIEVA